MTQNLLALETSPYLLQHRDNPVHWMAWGAPALERAKSEGKPILLSVGYAACHWCHVMAHESFEDDKTAALMNAHFVNIKVDREERPDVDRVYMQALHALGEQGGWPLTMFLTPDAEPFWGGTYFPPEQRYGRPSFTHVLTEIARIWREDRDKVATNSAALLAALKNRDGTSEGELSDAALDHAAAVILRAVDTVRGGLQGAPKFPQASLFSFLWTMARRRQSASLAQAVITTLRNIAQGGIYDHLGGGIARYSVDDRWLVPHFEKMLYDNAQFLAQLARIWVHTRDPLFRLRAEETVTFLLRDMTTEDDAFAASYDADSEGEEGRYYVWRAAEIDSELASFDAALFKRVYDVKPQGNWEGHTILNRLAAPELLDPAQEDSLARARQHLLDVRSRRIPPGFDDKVLADWNGLAISAIADAALVFDNPHWRDTAIRTFDGLMRRLWTEDRLRHSWRAGTARHNATADGYANLIAAALALYRVAARPEHLAWAERLCESLQRLHGSEQEGGYYFSSSDSNDIIVRQRSASDDATPNANGIMLANLARLHHITGNAVYLTQAEALHRSFAGDALKQPFGHPSLLEGFIVLSDPVQVALTGVGPDAPRHPLLRRTIERLGPDVIVTYVPDASALPPAHPAHGKAAASTAPRLYLCRGQTCATPAETPAQVDEAIDLLRLG